jgi:hypothetical protein
MHTEAMPVGVVMQRRRLDNPWQSHQWRPLEVIAGDQLQRPPGVYCLREDDADSRWLHAGLEVALYSDEGEGYHLNVNAPQPCWFIMWRMDEIDGVEVAVPKSVTLSYNEAARLMDGGEQVDTVPLPEDMVALVAGFAAEHYRPEPKRKRRKPSFEGGAVVQQMADQEKGTT